MTGKPIAIGIGEYLWDLLPEGKKAGGAPVNFAYHAAAAGCDACAITALGDDALGDELLHLAADNGIKLITCRTNFPTGSVKVDVENGEPVFTIEKNVAWDNILLSDYAIGLARKASAVCFGTLAQRCETSRQAIKTLLENAPDDAFKIFDINLRQDFWSKSVIAGSLDMSNVLKINVDELQQIKPLFGLECMSDEDACKSLIRGWRLRLVILTAGSQYSSVFYDDMVSTIKTPQVDVVDTVGAGDAFLGAFIGAILSGKSVINAHQTAVDRAAEVCRHAGAWV